MRQLLGCLLAICASAQQSFDEKLKLVGLEFAARVSQPGASAQRLQDLTDALNGGEAGAPMSATGGAARLTLADVPAAAAAPTGGARVRWAAAVPADAFFVDAARGDDGAAGSEASPFRTIARGVAAARGGGGGRTVVLRAGTFFQGSEAPAGIQLTAADSGLTLMAFPGEAVWISGAAPLANLSWAPFRVNASSGDNVWVASTAGTALATRNFTGLRAGAERLVRARYPNNANPELGMGAMFQPQDAHWDEPAWCPRGVCARPPARFEPASPSRANESRSGTLYTLGIGGDGCSLFSPPAGFNCVDNQRWGGMVLRWPAGFNATASEMPGARLPYSAAIADPRNPAQINGWQGWFSRHFLVAGYDAARNHFTFGEGGYQGAEGMDDGFPMSIENVFEELDAPGEWFHDVVRERLYVFWNASAGSAPNLTLAATQARVLFNATGTQAAPVANVSFVGLGFRDTAHTLFEPHGHPSSGDWALQRTAALFFEGTVGAAVDGCVFERFDGLAVFLSGFARGASVTNSEFAWGGETAIALWGYGRGSPVPGVGPDMSGGDQPRGTRIAFNVFRELGVWQKQSAAVFQAEAGLSVIENNFIYNGPRAGINFNDGSLGGSLIQYNVMANLCRESGDHGPFNSWDRTAYFNDLRGFTSSTKLTDTFVSNFIIANYGSMAAIDNDDTSGHYEAHHNVFAYSEMGLKVDFAGHDNDHHDNLYAFPQMCGYLSEYHPHALDGHGASFYNNICAMTNDPSYYIMGQTCNYTQPGGQWSFVAGRLLPGNDDGQGTRATTIEAAKQACGGGNSWCIGFTYNLSSLAFPPLGQQTSLAPTGDLARGLRHCSYVCSADVVQQGDDDFHFILVAPLNKAAAPGAVSVQSVNYPDHYLSPIAGGGGKVGINAAPDADDATWQLVPGLADGSNWTLVSQSKTAPAGSVLSVAATTTNPCGDGPDVVLAAPGGAAPGLQTWLIGDAPVPPGEMLISFKRMGGVVPDATHGSWVYPEKEGLTAVYNNTIYTHAGWVLECGLNLTDWQAQAPDHDPGSTVAPMPDDDVLIAAARRVLGL